MGLWKKFKDGKARVNSIVSGAGAGKAAQNGRLAHARFHEKISQLVGADLSAEVSYLHGLVVIRATPGSVRLDAVAGRLSMPNRVYEMKTGGKSLAMARIAEIRAHVPGGSAVRVVEIYS